MGSVNHARAEKRRRVRYPAADVMRAWGGEHVHGCLLVQLFNVCAIQDLPVTLPNRYKSLGPDIVSDNTCLLRIKARVLAHQHTSRTGLTTSARDDQMSAGHEPSPV